MIDAHKEYTHGLASDQRMQHAPKSSSQNGWDLRPYEESSFAQYASDVLALVIRHGPGFAFWLAVVIGCLAVWSAKGGI